MTNANGLVLIISFWVGSMWKFPARRHRRGRPDHEFDGHAESRGGDFKSPGEKLRISEPICYVVTTEKGAVLHEQQEQAQTVRNSTMA
ncbi:MAG: hypothetical protein ACE5OQ_04940 [Woeseia sp.]